MGGCCTKGGRNEGSDMIREEVEEEEEVEEFHDEGDVHLENGGARVRLEGACGFACLHSQQGRKGVNQDAMTLWEDFTGEKETIYCGVFDGHGPLGHRVSRYVRDALPGKLSSEYKSLQQPGGPGHQEEDGDANTHPWFSPWKASFFKAFREMDEELGHGSRIDCVCSGTTAVSIVKQRDLLVVANLGDSRAVLCTRDDTSQLVPVQLTVDLKPDLPNEARRIKSCQGRVFALEEEPEVHRLWMPDENCPGLAMARAFGDFCLKQFGLISTPEVTYRKLTERDEFVVLATDGVWDVLSNMDVVKIVSSVGKRSHAARHLVGRAVRAWETKHPDSTIDDCAAICLFLNSGSSSSMAGEASAGASAEYGRKALKPRELSMAESFKTARSAGEASEYFDSANPDEYDDGGDQEEWTALEGVSRANSVTRLPRFPHAEAAK